VQPARPRRRVRLEGDERGRRLVTRPTCPRCGKPRRPDHKFCTAACGYKARTEAALETVECAWPPCKNTFQRKKVPHHGKLRNYCSTSCSTKFTHSRGRIETGPATRPFCGANKLEREAQRLCAQIGLNLRFVGDDPYITVAGYSVDFINELLGVCVEVNGDNWHDEEETRYRVNRLREAGWECFVVWQSEIRGKNWARTDKKRVALLKRRLKRWYKRVMREPPTTFEPPVRNYPPELPLEGDLAGEESLVVSQPTPVEDGAEAEYADAVPF
jgi:very-short-patch-repair endonuclease